MWQQFLTKRYWRSAASNFLWFLVLNTVISYFFKESESEFWSLSEIQSRFVFAFFMSTLLAFRHKETNQAETKEDVALVIKWNAKDFLNIFGMLLVFSLLILSFLFGLSWLIYSFIDSNLEPTGKLYLRMLFTGSIMCLVMAAILFTCNRLGISWEFRS